MSEFIYSIPFSNEKLLAGIIYQLKHDNHEPVKKSL